MECEKKETENTPDGISCPREKCKYEQLELEILWGRPENQSDLSYAALQCARGYEGPVCGAC